jgi:hypothetical protein
MANSVCPHCDGKNGGHQADCWSKMPHWKQRPGEGIPVRLRRDIVSRARMLKVPEFHKHNENHGDTTWFEVSAGTVCVITETGEHRHMPEEWFKHLYEPVSDSAHERAKLRPANYTSLRSEEQWEIDNELGILDWDGL